MRIGLALGGGGTRGLAHVGVLAVLERAEVAIDCVAGTSAGAIVGALYCAGTPVARIHELALKLRWWDFARPTVPTQGFVSLARLERWLVAELGHLDFADLAIPFAAVAANLENGRPVVLREGPLAPAVRASSSVPGLVTPVELDGQRLGDGGVVDIVPASVVQAMDADYVIAVDLVTPAYHRKWGPFGRGFTALETLVQQAGAGIQAADCLIAPDLAGFSYVRFSNKAETIARGERAAEEKIPHIQQATSPSVS